VREVRARSERDSKFPPTLIVHPSDQASGEAFFAAEWPAVRSICDPNLELFEAFAFRRGSIGALLGPKVLAASIRAMLRGHGIGRPRGDILRAAGALILDRSRVLWEHRPAHIGVHLDLDEVAGIAARSAG
jgi:hypothetical protein